MKKIVLTYGLIAGAIMGLIMLITFLLIGCDYSIRGMIIGYTSMVLAFTLIFFGTRSYRDTIQHGVISFGRAFGIGILISLIASVIYVLVWMIFQHFMFPDFYEQYGLKQIELLQSNGASAVEIANAKKDLVMMKDVGNSPVMIFFFTLLEPLPVALLGTLISALILKRKEIPSVQ
jgi:hypothetical protein